MTYFNRNNLINRRLQAHKIRTIWYWNLRNAGFENVEAERFLDERLEWLDAHKLTPPSNYNYINDEEQLANDIWGQTHYR